LFEDAQGILILDIVSGSQAEKVGLKRGDIVVAYDGQLINSVEKILNMINANINKSEIILKFIRAEAKQAVTLQRGKIGIYLADITEKTYFMEKFLNAVEKKDVDKIQQIISQNLDIAKEMQESIEKLGQGTSENAKQNRALAELIARFLESIELNHLIMEGNKAYEVLNYDTALEKWKEGLEKAKQLSDEYYSYIFISLLLTDIGDVYRNLEQHQEALNSYQQASEINRKINNKESEGNNLGNIGNVYRDLEQYQKALDFYQQALEVHKELKDKNGEGIDLSNIGGVYLDLKQYQKALNFYEQGLILYREVVNEEGIGNNLMNIGIVYDNLGEHYKALDFYKQALGIYNAIGNKKREGINLYNIGNVYRDLGQYQKALNYYNQALEIYKTVRNEKDKESILVNAGSVYEDLGQYQKALNFYHQALEINKRQGNKKGESGVLSNIGNLYANWGQYQKALDFYHQSLKINKRQGSKIGANILSNIGNIYMNLGQYQKALDYHDQALEIDKKLGNKKGEETCLINIGIIYSRLGQYKKALDFYEQALEIQKKFESKELYADILANIGTVYAELSRYRKALDFFQQALEVDRKMGNKRGEGVNLLNIATTYNSLAQYQKALDFYQQALEIQRKLGGKKYEGDILGNIGTVYGKLGQYQKSLDYCEQSIVIAREIGNKQSEGNALANVGNVYNNFGQYSKALDFHQQALEIHRKIGNKKSEWGSLSNIGIVYLKLGQDQKALDFFQQALKIANEIGDEQGVGNNLGNIGVIYANPDLRQHKKALDFFQQSLEILRKIGDKNSEGVILNRIGAVYSNLGQYQKSLGFFQQALKIAKEIGDKKGEGINLIQIGMVYAVLEQYEEISNYFKDGAIIFETIDLAELWVAQILLALIEIHYHRYDIAIAHYEQALDNLEKLRGDLKEKEYKLSFMQNKIVVYDKFIDLLQMLHFKYPDKGYDRKAIEIFERKQGRVFLDEMGKSGTRRFGGIPEHIPQQETDLDNQLTAIHKQLTEQRSKFITEQDAEFIKELEQTIQDLEKQQANLEQRIKTDYPTYYALKYPQPISLEILQKNLLNADDIMLIYNVREEATDLWIIGKTSFQMVSLPLTEEQINQQVEHFREVGINTMLQELETAKNTKLQGIELLRHIQGAVQDNLPVFLKTSHALYQQLLPESARTALAHAKNLYIIPTGALYKLPFEALVDNAEESHYLIQNQSITYLSSASLLKTLRDAQERRNTEERQPLLAFANPDYPQKNCADLASDDSLDMLSTRAYSKTLRGDENACFPPLPETVEEVEGIANYLNINKNTLYFKEHASLEKLYELDGEKRLDDFQYVLFATHAVIPEDEINIITQPALLLSDGFLKMAKVFELQMNADLVSLSACNTGQDDSIKGEGVRGLTRAFMFAGTPAVAVTLWKVHSDASRQLSINLFSALKNGHTLAQSLQKAKLSMLNGEHKDLDFYRHPYFWAGFVVFGDGRAE